MGISFSRIYKPDTSSMQVLSSRPTSILFHICNYSPNLLALSAQVYAKPEMFLPLARFARGTQLNTP